jgi:hypothetical protein
MPQQCFSRLPIATARVVWWDAALIAPKDMYFTPIGLITKPAREDFEETHWGITAVQRDEKAIPFGN